MKTLYIAIIILLSVLIVNNVMKAQITTKDPCSDGGPCSKYSGGNLNEGVSNAGSDGVGTYIRNDRMNNPGGVYPPPTQDELISIMIDRITTSVTAGGGSGYYKQVDPKKLAEVLLEIKSKL